MAWRMAAWSRTKKRMPSLQSVLHKMRRAMEPKTRTVDPGEARRIGKMAEERLRELGRLDLLNKN